MTQSHESGYVEQDFERDVLIRLDDAHTFVETGEADGAGLTAVDYRNRRQAEFNTVIAQMSARVDGDSVVDLLVPSLGRLADPDEVSLETPEQVEFAIREMSAWHNADEEWVDARVAEQLKGASETKEALESHGVSKVGYRLRLQLATEGVAAGCMQFNAFTYAESLYPDADITKLDYAAVLVAPANPSKHVTQTLLKLGYNSVETVRALLDENHS